MPTMPTVPTMDFFTAMEVSASGLSAERTRMNVAASKRSLDGSIVKLST